MSLAYAKGYRAGRRKLPFGVCPYEGHTDASMALQLRWRDGYFDGLTAKRAYRRTGRSRTYRKAIRRRWPKNNYIRRRLTEALHER